MKLYVIGNPIKHSMSPQIHNMWLKFHKINAHYDVLEIKESNLPELVEKMRKDELIGFNITLPYKTVILKYIDQLDESANISGSVNTVYKYRNRIFGGNTDGIGFVKTLEKDLPRRLKIKNFFIIGSGGASRGIVFSLCKKNIGKILLTNRSVQNARLLIEDVKKKIGFNKIYLHSWENKYIPEEFNMVVNTTSVGLKKGEDIDINFDNLRKTSIIYDIIYNPLETEFLKKANSKHLNTFNGISMLVRQAAVSFKLWFGVEINEKLLNLTKQKLIKLLNE